MPFLVASSKEPTYYAGDMGSIPGPEDPLKKEMATHSGILACEIPWTEGAWQGFSPLGRKESDVTERLSND